MGPVSQANGHDEPGPIGELVPCVAAVIEDVAVGREDAVGDPVLAHVLPDVLHRVLNSGALAGSGMRVMVASAPIVSRTRAARPSAPLRKSTGRVAIMTRTAPVGPIIVPPSAPGSPPRSPAGLRPIRSEPRCRRSPPRSP